jgi:hypothetical protein
LSLIRQSAIKAIKEEIVIKGVSLIIYLKDTRSLQIKEASIVAKQSFTFKVAFLAFNIVMLAFIATSLLLIL